MTVEELMKPRYKVIADWPDSRLEIGTILSEEITDYFSFIGRYEIKTHTLCRNIDQYPHLFKRLEWWEERSIEDMPKYVKHTIGDKSIFLKNTKWDAIADTNFGFTELGSFIFHRKQVIPATEDEYLKQLKEAHEKD